jgi:nucleoside phosphorylase
MDAASYTIGWIAPLSLELTAAMAMLDEVYVDMHVDGYIFHGGRIGQHNLVLAVQPRMGTDAASDLAARMHAAFRNIEYFLVVGIGGGVPSYGCSSAKTEIVLGDVVVSYPRGQYGGVVRYDFGAWTDDGQLQFKGHTNGPPNTLLNAVNALQTKHSMSSGSTIPHLLQEMRMRIHVDWRRKFEDQGGEHDRLFDQDYDHPDSSRNEDCESGCDRSRSMLRHLRGAGAIRESDTPRIHYGNIASSNQLQISAIKRAQLQEELDVICFEMEGAGVIQTHPALIIRGICDYSDSHKNKRWQPYAAATAAAYAKELVQALPMSAFRSCGSMSGVKKTIGKWKPGSCSKLEILLSIYKIDLRWFYETFDAEMQETNYDFYSCNCLNHSDDEFLMGITNSSVFQSWMSQRSTHLWCRLRSSGKAIHAIPGACLIRQAVGSLSQQVYTFWYKCRDIVHIQLPKDYCRLKEKLAFNRNKKVDGNESHGRQDLIEVIILSFLMQAMQYGFAVDLESLDMSHPRLFLTSLTATFTKTVLSQYSRVILAIDNLELVREQELGAVFAGLTSIITQDQSNQCSVMLASESTPALSLLLKGYPTVHADSEYQGSH